MSNKYTQKGAAWNKTRTAVLNRAGGMCEWSGCTNKATEADHIIPTTKGGTNAMDNLQALCKPHNVRKSNRIIKSKKVTWYSPYWFAPGS